MTKKPLLRWLGEFVLVFLSVLGAFLVEDYRHNLQEQRDFISALISFRNDMHDDIRDFNYPIDTTNEYGGFVYNMLNNIDSALLINKVNEKIEVKKFILDRLDRLTKWRDASKSSEWLGQFPEQINANNVGWVISLYESQFIQQETSYDYSNVKVLKLRSYIIENTSDDFDSVVLESLLLDFRKEIEFMGWKDQDIINGFCDGVQFIDNILAEHHIDTSTLETSYLKYRR